MAISRRVLCDWGSSRLRAFLEVHGKIVDRCDGPGIGALQVMAPIDALRVAVTPWIESGSLQPIILCGMVGSRNGLSEVAYVTAPVGVDLWAAQSLALRVDELDLKIAPGVRAVNYADKPDVMRGEETQIFGAFDIDPPLAQGWHMILLPGTHSKWVEVQNGTIVRIQSFVTGELFAILRDHSSLLRAGDVQGLAGGGFLAGLERAAMGDIAEALFETRTAQLILDRSHGWAQGFLSGLLIGNEVKSVLEKIPPDAVVTVIGDVALTALYRQALAVHDVDAVELDGEQSAIAGLRVLAARTTGVN
jgi:2-dehydro-3-deoxygalactonokinase